MDDAQARSGELVIRQVLDRFSGRSRSAMPPRVGELLQSNRIEAGPDASHGIILYLDDITVSFDGFRDHRQDPSGHRLSVVRPDHRSAVAD
jgi:hypothetical protein